MPTPRKPAATPAPLPPGIGPGLPPIASIISTSGSASIAPALAGNGPLRAEYLPLKHAVSIKKHASLRENLSWAINNYVNAPNEIDTTTIPSRSAIGMLDVMQLSRANYSEFMALYKTIAGDKKSSDAAAMAEYDEHRQMKQLVRILDRHNGVTDDQPPTGPSANV